MLFPKVAHLSRQLQGFWQHDAEVRKVLFAAEVGATICNEKEVTQSRSINAGVGPKSGQDRIHHLHVSDLRVMVQDVGHEEQEHFQLAPTTPL